MLIYDTFNYGLVLAGIGTVISFLFCCYMLPQGINLNYFTWMSWRGYSWELFAGILNYWTIVVVFIRQVRFAAWGFVWALFLFYFLVGLVSENFLFLVESFLSLTSYLRGTVGEAWTVYSLVNEIPAPYVWNLGTGLKSRYPFGFIPQSLVLLGTNDLSFEPNTGTLFATGFVVMPVIKTFFILFCTHTKFTYDSIVFFMLNWLPFLEVTSPRVPVSNLWVTIAYEAFSATVAASVWVNQYALPYAYTILGWVSTSSWLSSLWMLLAFIFQTPGELTNAILFTIIVFFVYRIVLLTLSGASRAADENRINDLAALLTIFYTTLSALQFKAWSGYKYSIWWQRSAGAEFPVSFDLWDILPTIDQSPLGCIFATGFAFVIFSKDWLIDACQVGPTVIGIWLNSDFLRSPLFGDWVSFWLVFLVIFSIFISAVANPISAYPSSGHVTASRGFILTLLWIGLCMVVAFSTTNILFFYCAFEGVLIPTFFLIAGFGSSFMRTPAAYRLLLFTVAGSVAFLAALALIYIKAGTFNFWELLGHLSGDAETQCVLFFLFFVGFAFKAPMFPVYLWLTSAHVEAPTTGSMLLAGLMLKLGIYGLLRFGFQLCPVGLDFWYPLCVALPLIGFTVISYLTCACNDLKRVVAYTSISHMNFLLVALVAGGDLGFASAMYTMVSHAFISMGLFFIVGCVYRRFGSRAVVTFSGLASSCPKLATFLIIFLFSNAGLPLFAGFPGELLGFMAIWQLNPLIFILTLPGFFFIIFSMFRMIAQLLGSYRVNSYAPPIADLSSLEQAVCWFFMLWQCIGAFAPFFFISPVL